MRSIQLLTVAAFTASLLLFVESRPSAAASAPAPIQQTICGQALPTPPCGDARDVGPPQNAVVQVSHASPWTAQAPLTGFCPNPTSSIGVPRCQVSTKVIFESPPGPPGQPGTGPGNEDYFGIRMKNFDVYTSTGCVGGCNATHDEGPVEIRCRILPTSTAVYGVDYTLLERNYPIVDLPVSFVPGTNMTEFTLTLDVAGICPGTPWTDPGVALKIVTVDNTDGAAGNQVEFECVDIEILSALATNSGTTVPIGWSHLMRWIIEDNQVP